MLSLIICSLKISLPYLLFVHLKPTGACTDSSCQTLSSNGYLVEGLFFSRGRGGITGYAQLYHNLGKSMQFSSGCIIQPLIAGQSGTIQSGGSLILNKRTANVLIQTTTASLPGTDFMF